MLRHVADGTAVVVVVVVGTAVVAGTAVAGMEDVVITVAGVGAAGGAAIGVQPTYIPLSITMNKLVVVGHAYGSCAMAIGWHEKCGTAGDNIPGFFLRESNCRLAVRDRVIHRSMVEDIHPDQQKREN